MSSFLHVQMLWFLKHQSNQEVKPWRNNHLQININNGLDNEFQRTLFNQDKWVQTARYVDELLTNAYAEKRKYGIYSCLLRRMQDKYR